LAAAPCTRVIASRDWMREDGAGVQNGRSLWTR